jgi:integrase
MSHVLEGLEAPGRGADEVANPPVPLGMKQPTDSTLDTPRTCLGHKDVGFTMQTYVHVTETMENQATDAIAEVLYE